MAIKKTGSNKYHIDQSPEGRDNLRHYGVAITKKTLSGEDFVYAHNKIHILFYYDTFGTGVRNNYMYYIILYIFI